MTDLEKYKNMTLNYGTRTTHNITADNIRAINFITLDKYIKWLLSAYEELNIENKEKMKKVQLITCLECQYKGYVNEFWVYENRNDDCEKVFRCPACKELEPRYIREEVKE